MFVQNSNKIRRNEKGKKRQNTQRHEKQKKNIDVSQALQPHILTKFRREIENNVISGYIHIRLRLYQAIRNTYAINVCINADNARSDTFQTIHTNF